MNLKAENSEGFFISTSKITPDYAISMKKMEGQIICIEEDSDWYIISQCSYPLTFVFVDMHDFELQHQLKKQNYSGWNILVLFH